MRGLHFCIVLKEDGNKSAAKKALAAEICLNIRFGIFLSKESSRRRKERKEVRNVRKEREEDEGVKNDKLEY